MAGSSWAFDTDPGSRISFRRTKLNGVVNRIRPYVKFVRSNTTLRKLVEMPLTIVGVACFSTAAFIGNEIAGFAVTGICLIVLELMISDPEVSNQ